LVPKDVTSREFAEWLTNEYRLAMTKGILRHGVLYFGWKGDRRMKVISNHDEKTDRVTTLVLSETNGFPEQRLLSLLVDWHKHGGELLITVHGKTHRFELEET